MKNFFIGKERVIIQIKKFDHYGEIFYFSLKIHSALIRNLIKLKGTAKLTTQDEQVCLKDSKYILIEILENRTWKGRTSSSQ